MDGSSIAGDVGKTSLTSPNGIGKRRSLEIAEIYDSKSTKKPPNYEVAITYTSNPDQTYSLPNQCEDSNENRNQNNSNTGKEMLITVTKNFFEKNNSEYP